MSEPRLSDTLPAKRGRGRPPRPLVNGQKPPPEFRWTQRMHRAVELMVLGWSHGEIAKELGYSYIRISQLARLPQILAAVDALRAQFRARVIGSVYEDLELDTRNTFDKLKEHRDNADPQISLRACHELWDRQVLKRSVNDETHITKLVIEHHTVQYLRAVAAEDDEEVIDVVPIVESP